MSIMTEGHSFLANLILLPFDGLNVIPGID